MNRANDFFNLIDEDLDNDLILGAIEAIVSEEGESERDETANNDNLIDQITNGILTQALRKEHPPPTYGHVQCDDGEHIYIVGGYKPSQPILDRQVFGQQRQQYRPLRDVWRFNMITKKWALCSSFGPKDVTNIGLCGSAAAIINKEMYVLYGFKEKDLSDIFKLNLTSWNWTRISLDRNTMPPPRNKHGVWTNGSKIIIFGGFGPTPVDGENLLQSWTRHDHIDDPQDTRAWNDDLFYFDTDTGKHYVIADSGKRPCPRAAFGYSQYGKSAFLFGGRCAPGRTNDLFHFDMDSFLWTEIKTTGPMPERRSWMTLTTGSVTMLLYGGLDDKDNTMSDAWIFDPYTVIDKIGPAAPQGVQIPNLWKKCDTDFQTRSWQTCPKDQHCRMWHTASYNRYSGDFIIAGGATKQSNDDSIDDEPLSEHILQFRVSVPSLVNCSSSSLRRRGLELSIKTSIPQFGYIFDNERFHLQRELSFLIKTFQQNCETKIPGTNHINNIMSNRGRIALELTRSGSTGQSGHRRSSRHQSRRDLNYIYMQIETFTSVYIRARQLHNKIRGFADLSSNFDEFLSPVLHPEQTSARFLRLYSDEFHGII